VRGQHRTHEVTRVVDKGSQPNHAVRVEEALTPNQIVASNVRRARLMRGLTQDEAAEVLAPYLGAAWSKAVWSAMERSVDGGRVREFTADDLVALSRAFGLSIAWFLIPPSGYSVAVAGPSPTGLMPASELVDVLGSNTEEVTARLVEFFREVEGRDLTSQQLDQLDAVRAERTALFIADGEDLVEHVSNLHRTAALLLRLHR